MIRKGNAIVERIESYRDSIGNLPKSLEDIGIPIIDESNPAFYYEQFDSSHWMLSFGTDLGESKIYYSDSREWEDFYRPIGDRCNLMEENEVPIANDGEGQSVQNL